MNNNIILVGAAASGKDYLRTRLIEKGWHASISETTRTPRINEKDGVDYFFIDEGKFKTNIATNQYLEWCEFNGWFYGTPSYSEMTGKNLFIMTPGGIKQLPSDFRKRSLIIYLDMPEELRLERLKDRNDNADSLQRRLAADREDFKDFIDWDLRITSQEDIKILK